MTVGELIKYLQTLPSTKRVLITDLNGGFDELEQDDIRESPNTVHLTCFLRGGK